MLLNELSLCSKISSMKYNFVAFFCLFSFLLDGVAAKKYYYCSEPVDVAVLLDISSYFGLENLPQLKLFAKNFITYFLLTNNGLKSYIGFIPYSDKVVDSNVINFRHSTSTRRLRGKIDRLNFDTTWGTRLDLALKYAREKLFTVGKGSRTWVPHVVLAITGSAQYWDSPQRDKISFRAKELRKAGVQLLIASVGPTPGNNGYLRSLVDSQEHLYVLSYPYLLYGVSENIAKQVCPLPLSTLSCPGKVDIAFIVDSSGSISSQDYNKMKYFMFSIAKAVNISETGAHVGIVIYSQSAEMVVKFNDHTNITRFRDVVENLKHMKSFTRIDLGLQVAHAQLFSPVYGGARPGVKKLAFILTDGRQSSANGIKVSLKQAVRPLHETGVKTLSIGIGSAVERGELRAMVEYDEDVITTENFDQLIRNIQNITQLTCEEITITPCEHEADIVFLVDSSTEVPFQDFQEMKNFLVAVEKRFRISEFGNRLGVILYGNRAETVIRLDGKENSTEFSKTVGNLWPIGGRRESYRALQLAENVLYDFENGARRNSPKVVIMMTAGRENSFSDNAYLYQAAKRLRDRGVIVIAVGIGSDLSRDTLLQLVGTSANLFNPKYFEELKDEASALSDSVCENIGPVECDKATDIAFILDSSGSIMKKSFLEARNLVEAIADTFTISRQKTHVALMIYSNEARIMAKFNNILSHKALRAELSDLPHLREKTRIDLALKLAAAELFTGNGGMRWLKSVPKVALVITDGRQSPAADAIRLDEAVAPLLVRGVKVLAIGVGNQIDRTELEMMVKSSELAFWAESYGALRVQLAAIARESCLSK